MVSDPIHVSVTSRDEPILQAFLDACRACRLQLPVFSEVRRGGAGASLESVLDTQTLSV